MRLINTTSYQLIQVAIDYVPAYAILSHRWGEGEVTFQDLEDPIRREKISLKEGYQKIVKFCEVAASHHIRWGWVDTCCIDKTSSAELSEAINSMFDWYKNSKVCFAYLRDVAPGSHLQQSEWFKRGWTLQELLAPGELRFLDRDWQIIGTRMDYCEQIHRATSIPLPILCDPRGFSPKLFTIAERMSWMAGRETARPEDEAYCLLGLFGINMPLLYGEGSKKAFYRLQSEILDSSDDESIFFWNDPDLFKECAPLASRFNWFSLSKGSNIPTDTKNRRKPWSMTNRGLSITLLLHQTTESELDEYLEMSELPSPDKRNRLAIAPIHCRTYGSPLYLILFRAKGSEDVYHRFDVRPLKQELPKGLQFQEQSIFISENFQDDEHLELERALRQELARQAIFGNQMDMSKSLYCFSRFYSFGDSFKVSCEGGFVDLEKFLRRTNLPGPWIEEFLSKANAFKMKERSRSRIA